jgi:hypothetical protein
MVQQWHWFQPFVMCRKPSETELDITENARGQPMAPAYPVEWFANLSIFHKKQLEETINSLCGQDVRFAEEPTWTRISLASSSLMLISNKGLHV